MYKSLELFSGKGTISEMLKCAGFETTTIDIRYRHGISEPSIQADIRHIDFSLIPPGLFSVLWASPVCTAFSLSSGNRFFSGGKFLDSAKPYIDLLEHTIYLIKLLKPRLWFIENPRGRIVECESYRSLMRQEGVSLHLLTYGSYGEYATKPTYLLTNSSFVPRPCVGYGRGRFSKGCLKNSSSVGRSHIPMELAADVAVYCKQFLVKYPRPCAVSCSPSDYYIGGKCDRQGCFM